jgi:hypothetical protein
MARLLQVSAFVVVLVCIQAQVGVAELDITGLPSAVPMRSGLRHVVTQHRVRVAAVQRNNDQAAAVRDHGRVIVAKTPVIKVMQNLTLAFVDPNGRPVPNLPVSVAVVTKGGRSAIQGTTDLGGRVQVARINPLPASVEVNVKSPLVGSMQMPEWEASNPETASVLLEKATGSRVAVSGNEPYLVASTVFVARSAAPKSKTVTYSATKQITLVRNVVDLKIAGLSPGTTVSWPSVDASGAKGEVMSASVAEGETSLAFQVPAFSYSSGAVPLAFTRKTDAGVFEGTQTDYRHDPYSQDNNVESPKLELVALGANALPEFARSSYTEDTLAYGKARVNLGQTLDASLQQQELLGLVLKNGTAVESTCPEVKKRGKDKSLLENNADGSQWWKAPRAGLWFKMRMKPAAKDPKAPDMVVECVRMVSPLAGSLAGITVGDDQSKVRDTLGDGDETSRTVSYLDKGIRFNLANRKVESIDVMRPTILLTEGTTAFVPRKPVALYVGSFEAGSGWSVSPRIVSQASFNGYMSKTGSVTLVDDPASADYVLTCKTSGFQEDKDNFLDLIPLQYKCSMDLTYSLRDNASGQTLIDNKTVNAGYGYDYWKPMAVVLVAAGFIEKSKSSDTVKWIERILGVAYLKGLHDCAEQTAKRCPALVEQVAYSKMMDDLYDTFDFKARVTKIDYESGTAELNVGTEDGVQLGGHPSSFELLLDNQSALPFKEEGTEADFYAAEVVSADAHTCVCKVRHINRRVKQSIKLFGGSSVRESVEVKDDTDIVRRLPEPTTGVVSVRMKNRFLPLVPEPVGAADSSSR